MSIQRRFKQAGVSIEIIIAIALSVVALFFILGLFSDNLHTMATTGKLAQMNNNNETKTQFAEGNPTKTEINVQLVGDQGTLAWYNAQAKATIEQLGAKTTPLTDQEKIDLAKALTIFGDTSANWGSNALSQSPTLPNGYNYLNFGISNGIKIDYDLCQTQYPPNHSTPGNALSWPDGGYNQDIGQANLNNARALDSLSW